MYEFVSTFGSYTRDIIEYIQTSFLFVSISIFLIVIILFCIAIIIPFVIKNIKPLIPKNINPYIFIKKYRHKKYIKRLEYVSKELDNPDKWIDEYVRISKKDAVLWLLHHYEGEDPFYDVEPKQRIMDVLDMSIRDFTPKDKVYLQVLNYWCEYKRIQGF